MYLTSHQSCSGPRKMMQSWICYPAVLWMVYEAWTTSDRGESPHRPMHDLQLPQAELSCYPGLQKKNLNNVPHQFCSGPRKMKQVWIWHSTVLWRLYKACTIFDRGESSHIPLHDLQLHLVLLRWLIVWRCCCWYFIDWLWCGLWHRFGLLDAWYWRLLCIVLRKVVNGVEWPLGFT